LPIDRAFLVIGGLLALVIFGREVTGGAARTAMEAAGVVLVPLFVLLLACCSRCSSSDDRSC
jgi:hypothetical protein